MKKAVSLAFCIMLAMTMVIVGNANESTQNRVYAERINAVSKETVSVPIKISNNTGFMGFAVFISYDPDVISPVSATKSSALKGMFDDSIETAAPGSFKVVYTDTEDITADGELFSVTFSVNGKSAGSTAISLSYSKEDTFNGQWQPVEFNCENVILSFDPEPVQPEPVQEKLSDKIQRKAAKLASPWNRVVKFLAAPIVFILRLFGF